MVEFFKIGKRDFTFTREMRVIETCFCSRLYGMYFILSLTSLWTLLAPLTSCLAKQIGSCLEFQQDSFFSEVIRMNTLIKNKAKSNSYRPNYGDQF